MARHLWVCLSPSESQVRDRVCLSCVLTGAREACRLCPQQVFPAGPSIVTQFFLLIIYTFYYSQNGNLWNEHLALQFLRQSTFIYIISDLLLIAVL